jgi:hypothetical protein
MYANYNRTRSKKRAGKLNVQNVYWVTSQLGTKSEGYADERRVRKSRADPEVGPPVAKPCYRLIPGNIQSVIVDRIDLSQRFN